MSLNDIKFVLGQGGLGRPLPGEDYISGLIFYTATLPSGFDSNNRIKNIFQITDAENLGIKSDLNDETQATGTYLVSAVGANGDTITIKVAEPAVSGTTNVTLGTYTKVSGDSSTANVATGIAAAINAGTPVHGYSATIASSTVTIKARKGLGVFLNTGTPITVTIVGAIAGTLTQFSGGVASLQAVWHYHISEFFRMQQNNQGNLFLGFFAVPGGTPTFPEVQTIQDFSGGKLRQIGVFNDFTAYVSSQVATLETVSETNDTNHKPHSVIYGADISSISDLSTLADLSALTAKKVSVCIGQDGAALGFTLFKAYGKSITTLGNTLGTIAAANVSDDIAWVGKFNTSNGAELDTDAFANGTLGINVSVALKNTLNNYRYIFLRKFVGVTGTFYNDDHTSIATTSDYAYISNVRVIDKAIREVRANMLPALNSPITVNADGTLTDNSIAYFTSLAGVQLDQMIRDSEISSYSVTIDPTQDILSTSQLNVTIKIVPIGAARNIVITIGFAANV